MNEFHSFFKISVLRKKLVFFIVFVLQLLQSAQAEQVCPAIGPVPADFQWGLVAYHVNLPSYELHADDFDRFAQNGVQWIRVDFAWGRIEPVQGGAFDFSYFDKIVAEAKARGIHIAATLGNGYNTKNRPVAPLWSQDLSARQYINAIQRYSDAVVARYANDVDVWGLENEIHIAPLHALLKWRSRAYFPDTNTKILRTLSDSVVKYDPNSEIVLTLSPGFLGWQRFVRDSVKAFRFDTVGLYSYPSFNEGAEPVGFEASIANQISSARQASAGKSVVIFETGYQTPPDDPATSIDEGAKLLANQVTYIDTMTRAAIDGGAKGIYFYQYLDGPDEKIARERVFGLVYPDRTPKPAWNRYGDAIRACQN